MARLVLKDIRKKKHDARSTDSQAATTPKIRAAIQTCDDPAWMVSERYGISEQTVLKWRHRDSVEDRSHTPHRFSLKASVDSYLSAFGLGVKLTN